MRLRVATLNVLAYIYLEHGTYSKEALAFLRSEERIPALVRLIRGLKADVIALQEVEPELVVALQATNLWQVLWGQKTHNKPDGCAFLVRHGVTVLNYGREMFADSTGHIWQWIQVGDALIVNTHIKWSPEDAKVHDGVRQMEELLARLLDIPTIIMGDCNGRPGGRVRNVLEAAGFTNAWGSLPTALIIKDGVTEEAPIDIIAVRRATTRLSVVLGSVKGIPNERNPSDHIPVVVDVETIG
jgi:endonuclease/exonuclease/phosphatase family metal-dependent hydrolase